MVRGQCLHDGSFTNIMPLWGDYVIKPEDPDYVNGNIACAPLYQVSPNKITLTRGATPLTFQFLYEEKAADLDSGSGLPSADWLSHYFDSFRRLQKNVQTQASIKFLDRPPETGSVTRLATNDSRYSLQAEALHRHRREPRAAFQRATANRTADSD